MTSFENIYLSQRPVSRHTTYDRLQFKARKNEAATTSRPSCRRQDSDSQCTSTRGIREHPLEGFGRPYLDRRTPETVQPWTMRACSQHSEAGQIVPRTYPGHASVNCQAVLAAAAYSL